VEDFPADVADLGGADFGVSDADEVCGVRYLQLSLLLLAGCSELKPAGDPVPEKPKFKVIASRPAGVSGSVGSTTTFQFIEPTSNRGAMVFDQSTGCLAEVNLPKPTDMTGQTVEGKKLNAEEGRQWFGLIYFNQWTCPKPLNDKVLEAAK